MSVLSAGNPRREIKSIMAKLRIFIFILIIAILGAGVYFVSIHTNNFKNNFTTFYVECDGERLESDSNLEFKDDSYHQFKVVYPFDVLSKETTDYSVNIVPYTKGETVEYTIGGRVYLFSALGQDLTSAFDITYEEDGFTLNIKKYFSIKSVLDKTYSDKTVEVSQKYIESNAAMYTLIITSYDGSAQYKLNFGVSNRQREDVRDVELDIIRIVL